LAILESGGHPAGNWLSATTPFFARAEIVAVVPPKMAPLGGSLLQRGAAAVDESRIGAGLGYFRFTPGNVRFVHTYPASTVLVRKVALLALPEIELDDMVSALDEAGGRVIYTPESVVIVDPPPLFGPHLRVVLARGRSLGARLRRGGIGARAAARWSPPLVVLVAVIVWGVLGGSWLDVLLALLVVYVGAVLLATAAATLRFQSVRVGVVAAGGLVATHLAFLVGVARGLAGA
jgi:hypothetical protein